MGYWATTGRCYSISIGC